MSFKENPLESKYEKDIGLGSLHRAWVVQQYLNPFLEMKKSKLRFVKSDKKEGKGLHYWLMDPAKPEIRLKVHLRQSGLTLYLKMPSKHLNPEDFLKAEQQAFFVFYEVKGGKPTGRFGSVPVSIGSVMKEHNWHRSGARNENRILFTSFPLKGIAYTRLDENYGMLVPTDLLTELVKHFYDNLFKEKRR